MNNNTSIIPRPSDINRLTKFYIAFRFKNWFISDNTTVFQVPRKGFCTQCFMRRYFAEYNCEEVTTISNEALHLASKIDKKHKPGSLWTSYSVKSCKKIKTFALSPYESCQKCTADISYSKDKAQKKYNSLLKNDNNLNLGKISKQIFSFGFAHSISTKNKQDLGNEYFEKILGDNFFTHINARFLTANGKTTHITTLGYAQDRVLTEIKATMEYLERYAFLEHSLPLKTNEVNEDLISKFLSLFSGTLTNQETLALNNDAIWGIDLIKNKVCPIPTRFIYDNGDLSFIKPSSSGFAAHKDFSHSISSSIIELVERDAFVRFWHDPESAYNFSPSEELAKSATDIVCVFQELFKNTSIVAHFYVVQSPANLPVVMSSISSSDFSAPPSLIFGYGAGFSLEQAALKSLDELKTNALNVLSNWSNDKSFLNRTFNANITSIPERMNLYATHQPRASLRFLDTNRPLVDNIYKELEAENLNGVIERFTEQAIEIYGIDTTPKCFVDTGISVTRAFSPQLYPLQFENEDVFNLATGTLSAKDKLPHFFI